MTSVAFRLFVVIGLVLLLSVNPGLAAETAAKRSKLPNPHEQPIHDKWAVIVGVGKFQDPGVPPLRYGTRSASEIVKLLQDPMAGRFASGHILSLTGAAATKQAIEQSLIHSWLTKKALPNDLIVIYFCTRVLFNQAGTEVNLCAYDTLASEADVSSINLKELLKEVRRRTQCPRILCLLDTSPCLEAVQTPRALVCVEDLARDTAVSLFAANELNQPSYESPIAASSYFAHYLKEGFAVARGLLPLAKVAPYVIESVKQDVLTTMKQSQCPTIALAPDSTDMGKQPIGVLVKGTASKIAIGHPVSQLALTRPDLVQPRRQTTADDDLDEDEDEPRAAIDFGSYMTQMKRNIQKHWQPPKGFENRRMVATFTILRDGTITDAELVDSSGIDSVDKSALDALKVASPLDPLPLGAPKSVRIRYQFDWRVTRN